MKLRDFLLENFRDGIPYEDAVQLCMSIYSFADVLPVRVPKEELSIDGVAEVFSDVSRHGLIKHYLPYKAVLYGANYHSVCDKGHWIEVMASIFKLQTTINMDRVKALLAEVK